MVNRAAFGQDLSHGSLFAGVDAFGIAIRALGGRTIWHSEVDSYCQKVLKLRFPEAEQLGDVREVGAGARRPRIVTGGFPCQDLSAAGNGAGLDGERSGLWSQYARVIGELEPELVVVENVSRLLGLHFERLLRDLHRLGYECEWDVIPAAAAGAPHLRERLWLLAYPATGEARTRAVGPLTGLCPLEITSDGVKWPRAGAMRCGEVFFVEPLAPRKTRRVDGRTYWTGVNLLGDGGGGPLWPTAHGFPRAEYKRVQGPSGNELGRAVLAEERRQGLLPTPNARDHKDYGPTQGSRKSPNLGTYVHQSLLPTPESSDGSGGRVASELGGQRPSGAKRAVTLATAVAHGLAPKSLLASAAATSYGSNQGGAAGRVGEKRHSLESMARHGLFPTPAAADGERMSEVYPRRGANYTLLGATRSGLWPTPSRAVGTGGPGRSDRRAGGDNLRTAIQSDKHGQLNPDWVEWMMGLPVGWTDLECAQPEFRPFWDEPLPRVARDIPRRRERLTAIGNCLVWLIPYWLLGRYDQRYGLPVERAVPIAA